VISEVGENVHFIYSTIFVDYENKNMMVVQKFSLPFGLMVITISEVKKKYFFCTPGIQKAKATLLFGNYGC
jgi:hypothetical protein